MSTAPCLFHRPPGTELVRHTKTRSNLDFAAISGAAQTMFSKDRRNWQAIKMVLEEQAVENESRVVRVSEGVYLTYGNLYVHSIDPCGAGKAHILCRDTCNTTVIIENYNFNSGKGDYWEFRELIGVYTGLIDPRRVFPLDSLNTGSKNRARLTAPVAVQDLPRILRERGYKLATTTKALQYRWFDGSESICFNQEGELVGVEWAGNCAYRITAEEALVPIQSYLLLEKLPVRNGRVVDEL